VTAVLLALLTVPAVVLATWWIALRPQRSVLLLAALLPFDGLLLLVDHPAYLERWKEVLVVVGLAATLLAPAHSRRRVRGPRPPWLPALLALIVVAVASGVFGSAAALAAGLKVGFFYSLVTITLWRCPLDRGDRDRLVGIMMAALCVTAVVALVQQVLGPDALVQLGYDYNTNVRFTGDRLRSFSTFADPFQYALFTMFALLVTLPVAAGEARRPRNRAFLLATPFIVVALATSVVRAAFGGLALGVVYLVGRRRPRLVLGGALVVLVGLAVVPSEERAVLLSPSSLIERVDGWTVAVADQLVETPLGAGIGTTGSAAEAAAGEELRVGPRDELVADDLPYQPDNQYLKMVLELGPIGLWLFVVFLVLTLTHARRVARRAEDQDRQLVDGITAAILGASAAALAATYWEVFPSDAYFWLALGVLTSIDHTSRSTPSRSGPAAPGSRPTSASSSAR
jgi:hypothetical protein